MISAAYIETKISAEKIQKIKDIYITSAPDKTDKIDWFKMWEDYAGDDAAPSKAILEHTWRRLLDSDDSFGGIFLYQKENKTLIGFAHYILHPSTWHKGLSCYIEDSYILKNHRKAGAMIALHDALLSKTVQEQWEEIYWMTRPDNLVAQRFYNRITKPTNWIRYEYNLSDKHE